MLKYNIENISLDKFDGVVEEYMFRNSMKIKNKNFVRLTSDNKLKIDEEADKKLLTGSNEGGEISPSINRILEMPLFKRVKKIGKFLLEKSKTKRVYSSGEIGAVIKVADGIATVENLYSIKSGEVIYIYVGKRGFVKALALNLNRIDMEVLLLGNENLVKEGDYVFRSGHGFEIDTSLRMFGRVVDAFGNIKEDCIIDKEVKEWSNGIFEKTSLVEIKAAGIVDRVSINTPLRTGLKSVDSLVPIGRGQRELIIGDRQTGKTSVAIDVILNHTDINNKIKKLGKLTLRDLRKIVWFVYAAVGQKQSSVSEISNLLKRKKSSWYTTIVSATSADSASLQFLAPYTACTVGEYIRDIVGGHSVVIYDDLTKHAIAYRQMSLLLRRPPGREAFPGDVFYIHSRLLERAGALRNRVYNKLYTLSLKKSEIEKGWDFYILPKLHIRGTLTAFPIIETQAGDVSAYIPTNVISITDGQIFLETELFYKGIRPAINVGLSVSRVGSAAQPPIMKKVSGSLKMELAQYREIENFAKLGSDLDAHTQRILTRGENLIEILKQALNQPISTYKQTLSIFLGLGYSSSWLTDLLKNIKLTVGSFLTVDRLKSSWFELFRTSSTSFKIQDINKFLNSLIKFYDLLNFSKIFELSNVETLNTAILKKNPGFFFDDLVLLYLLETSDFNNNDSTVLLSKLNILNSFFKKKEKTDLGISFSNENNSNTYTDIFNFSKLFLSCVKQLKNKNRVAVNLIKEFYSITPFFSKIEKSFKVSNNLSSIFLLLTYNLVLFSTTLKSNKNFNLGLLKLIRISNQLLKPFFNKSYVLENINLFNSIYMKNLSTLSSFGLLTFLTSRNIGNIKKISNNKSFKIHVNSLKKLDLVVRQNLMVLFPRQLSFKNNIITCFDYLNNKIYINFFYKNLYVKLNARKNGLKLYKNKKNSNLIERVGLKDFYINFNLNLVKNYPLNLNFFGDEFFKFLSFNLVLIKLFNINDINIKKFNNKFLFDFVSNCLLNLNNYLRFKTYRLSKVSNVLNIFYLNEIYFNDFIKYSLFLTKLSKEHVRIFNEYSLLFYNHFISQQFISLMKFFEIKYRFKSINSGLNYIVSSLNQLIDLNSKADTKSFIGLLVKSNKTALF